MKEKFEIVRAPREENNEETGRKRHRTRAELLVRVLRTKTKKLNSGDYVIYRDSIDAMNVKDSVRSCRLCIKNRMKPEEFDDYDVTYMHGSKDPSKFDIIVKKK